MASSRSNWNESLWLLRAQRAAIGHHLKLGAMACGWKKGDERLLRLGQESGDGSRARSESSTPASDVFIATTLYQIGGHTALIGDVVRALAQISPEATPHLIVTNANEEHAGPLSSEIVKRTALETSQIDMLQGSAPSDRLDQLLIRLRQLQPRRIFLFHHPDDPVAVAGIQPENDRQIFLFHHADSVPTFGLYLPCVRVVDLTPGAAAMSRAQELDSTLLLLTTPDPGPRPVGFLQRGKLVTASSGIGHKFKSQHQYQYADAVALILRTTGGWHVHIGPLDDSQLSEIREALRKQNIAFDRFIHVPQVDSVATALWAHAVDLYFASFPIGGARTNAEVFASATPHLRFSRRPAELPDTDPMRLGGGLVWRNWDEIVAALNRIADASALTEQSKLVRADYERFHQPRIFAERLQNILEGGSGWEGPRFEERMTFAIKRMRDAMAGNSGGSATAFSNELFQDFINRVAESYRPA